MKIKAIYLYFGFLVWVAILAILLKFAHLNVTGLGITLAFLTMIVLPGFLIFRLLKIRSENLAAQCLYVVGLGFGFYFLSGLLAIVLNLNIFELGFLIFSSWVIIFAFVFYQDHKSTFDFDLSWVKKQTLGDWLLLAGILVFAVIAFMVCNSRSGSLAGDGWFHLGVIRKIVSGEGLNPYNLQAIRTDSLNLVYSFPLWHIFLGFFSKILGISIFTALRQVLLPLVILTLAVWISLSFLIFKNKYLVYVVFLTLIIIFWRSETFRYLVALPSPDSFNRLLFEPLIFGLIIDYIFLEKFWWKNLAIIIILGIFMGLIHITQLIYLLLILIILPILFLLFFRDKKFIQRILYLLGGFGILFLPYLTIFSNTVTALFSNASTSVSENIVFKTFLGTGVTYRYAILSLPLICLYIKKQNRVMLLLAIMMTGLLIYWPFLGVRQFFFRFLGQIFVERSLANIPDFLYVGFAMFLIIYGLNLVLIKILKKYLYLVDIILVILIVFMPLMKNQIVTLIEGYILNERFAFYGPSFWIALSLISAGVIIYYLVFSKKEYLLPVVKEKLNFALLTLYFFLALSLPFWGNFQKALAENQMGSILSNRDTDTASDIDFWGGRKTIDFFLSQHGKIFLSDNVSLIQNVLLYSDNFAAEYPYSIEKFTSSLQLYNEDMPKEHRLKTLDSLNPNFVIIRHQEEAFFYDNLPEIFQKVFENNYNYKDKDKIIIIYQVLK